MYVIQTLQFVILVEDITCVTWQGATIFFNWLTCQPTLTPHPLMRHYDKEVTYLYMMLLTVWRRMSHTFFYNLCNVTLYIVATCNKH